MELINISDKYTALFGCKGCRTKKTKDLDQRVLKKNFNHTRRFLGCDEKFRLMGKKVYTHTNIWMARKNFMRQVYHQRRVLVI